MGEKQLEMAELWGLLKLGGIAPGSHNIFLSDSLGPVLFRDIGGDIEVTETTLALSCGIGRYVTAQQQTGLGWGTPQRSQTGVPDST